MPIRQRYLKCGRGRQALRSDAGLLKPSLEKISYETFQAQVGRPRGRQGTRKIKKILYAWGRAVLTNQTSLPRMEKQNRRGKGGTVGRSPVASNGINGGRKKPRLSRAKLPFRGKTEKTLIPIKKKF